jgi:NAD(P)-dependent dehydrogenase (short-subunit alcohol dehydrogenase family)
VPPQSQRRSHRSDQSPRPFIRSLKGAVAVVTGAGSGLGRAVAVALAARGCDLALADIDADGLAETRELVRGARVTTSRVDVSNLEEMSRFRDAVERDYGRASVLVNNAGVALYGTLDEVSFADLEWILGVNFWGAVYGTKLFLPLLLREPAANVVTISSVFGLIAPPMQSGYSASKFAVRGFSEVVRHELARTNVRVTLVHPGGLKTRIAASTRRGAGADAQSYARDTRAFERALVTSPEFAAARIVDAILRDRPRLLVGRDAFVLDAIARFFPARYMRVLGPLLAARSGRPSAENSRPREAQARSGERV